MENNGHNGNLERLDRIEGIIEALATSQTDLVQSQRQLLTAQVVLNDTVQKLAQHTSERIDALTANMNALIATVDDIIRGKHN